MSREFCTFFPQKVPIAVCDWCCLPLLVGKSGANRPADKKAKKTQPQRWLGRLFAGL